MDNQVTLTGILPILEGYDGSKSLLFINPDGNLQTFFSYKGTLIEINKLKLSQTLGRSSYKENGEFIRQTLVGGIQRGYWLVFDLDKNSSFNLDQFFKGCCPFFDKDSWYNFQNFKDKSYLEKKGILHKDEDKDFFENKGGYKPHETFKICYLCCCPESEIETLKKNIDASRFDIYIVK